MKIETSSKSKALSLSGKREVWVQVFSNEMHDWPSIQAKLSDAQRATLDALGPKVLSYFPHSPTAEEREEHGYSFEDFFVWAAR